MDRAPGQLAPGQPPRAPPAPGGTDDEIVGIYTPLEEVTSATFALPDPVHDRGNYRAAKLLQGALRLGFRSGAGPFRCLARIAVESRPYQLAHY